LNQLAVESLKQRLKPIVCVKGPDSNRMRRAAVVLILDPLRKEVSLLLVRRAVRESDPWSGQMALPGGYMTDHDSSVLDTAIRETQEEVGINLIDHELLGRINDVRSARRDLVIIPFVALLKTKVVLVLRKDEVAEADWIPINDLARSSVIKRRIKTSKGELEVDAMQYRDEIIWGLTLRMINDFLTRLNDRIEIPPQESESSKDNLMMNSSSSGLST